MREAPAGVADPCCCCDIRGEAGEPHCCGFVRGSRFARGWPIGERHGSTCAAGDRPVDDAGEESSDAICDVLGNDLGAILIGHIEGAVLAVPDLQN